MSSPNSTTTWNRKHAQTRLPLTQGNEALHMEEKPLLLNTRANGTTALRKETLWCRHAPLNNVTTENNPTQRLASSGAKYTHRNQLIRHRCKQYRQTQTKRKNGSVAASRPATTTAEHHPNRERSHLRWKS